MLRHVDYWLFKIHIFLKQSIIYKNFCPAVKHCAIRFSWSYRKFSDDKARAELVWGLQWSCAGRKWRWRYQPLLTPCTRHLRPAHDCWSPQTRAECFYPVPTYRYIEATIPIYIPRWKCCGIKSTDLTLTQVYKTPSPTSTLHSVIW